MVKIVLAGSPNHCRKHTRWLKKKIDKVRTDEKFKEELKNCLDFDTVQR